MNPQIRILLTGLSMGESPRWHNGRLWVCDWGAQQIVAVDQSGGAEVVAEGDFGLPFCIDWLPDGRLLVVAGRRHLYSGANRMVPGRLMRILVAYPLVPGTRLSLMAGVISMSMAVPVTLHWLLQTAPSAKSRTRLLSPMG